MYVGADYTDEIKKVLEKAGFSDRVDEWVNPGIQNPGIKIFTKRTDISTKSLVFCESGDLSFATIISAMVTLGGDKKILIHGQSTKSIVGSPAKDTKGISIALL